MCGGVFTNWNRVPKKELGKFLSKSELIKITSGEGLESFFWSQTPILPVEDKSGIHIRKWGNRDKELKLPKTGWAKQESLIDGKWNYLKPEKVKILADRGYEKGVWFDIESGGIEGILVAKANEERVYMVTKEASLDYKKLTGHGREAVTQMDFEFSK